MTEEKNSQREEEGKEEGKEKIIKLKSVTIPLERPPQDVPELTLEQLKELAEE